MGNLGQPLEVSPALMVRPSGRVTRTVYEVAPTDDPRESTTRVPEKDVEPLPDIGLPFSSGLVACGAPDKIALTVRVKLARRKYPLLGA